MIQFEFWGQIIVVGSMCLSFLIYIINLSSFQLSSKRRVNFMRHGVPKAGNPQLAED